MVQRRWGVPGFRNRPATPRRHHDGPIDPDDVGVVQDANVITEVRPPDGGDVVNHDPAGFSEPR